MKHWKWAIGTVIIIILVIAGLYVYYRMVSIYSNPFMGAKDPYTGPVSTTCQLDSDCAQVYMDGCWGCCNNAPTAINADSAKKIAEWYKAHPPKMCALCNCLSDAYLHAYESRCVSNSCTLKTVVNCGNACNGNRTHNEEFLKGMNLNLSSCNCSN
jgi:hypothetical protein